MKNLRNLFLNIVFILTVPLLGISQTKTPESIYLDGMDFKSGVKEYYTNVNKAEIQITKGNYRKASLCYSKAFKYKEPFLIDLHRALVAECLSAKDSATIINYLILKLKIGHKPIDVAEKLEVYADSYPDLTKMQYWKSLPKIFDTVKIEYLKVDSLSDALESIEEADQKIRREGIAKYTQPMLYKTPFADTIRAVDSINMIKLIALWEKYGEITGRNAANAESILEVLIIHSTAWHDIRWLKYLKAQLCNGTMDNKVYARLIDRCFNTEYSKLFSQYRGGFLGSSNGFTLYDKLLVFQPSKKQEKEVNERREKIYLCSFQEEQDKSLWKFRQKVINFNNDFIFYSNSFMDIEENATEAMINEYKAEQEKIIKKYNEKDIKLYNK